MEINSLSLLGQIWKSTIESKIISSKIPNEKTNMTNWNTLIKEFLFNTYEDKTHTFIRNNKHLRVSGVFLSNLDISLCRLCPIKCPVPILSCAPIHFEIGKRWCFSHPYGYEKTSKVVFRGFWFIKQKGKKNQVIGEDQHNLPYFIQRHYNDKLTWFITNFKETVSVPLEPFIINNMLNLFIKLHLKNIKCNTLTTSLIIIILEYGLLLGPLDIDYIKVNYGKDSYWDSPQPTYSSIRTWLAFSY